MLKDASATASEDGPKLTRRRLLQYGGTGIAAASFAGLHPWASAVASALAADAGAPPYLRRSSYAALTGQDLTATFEGRRESLSLLAVSDLQRPGLAGAEDAFALALSGPASTGLGQGIRTLSHPTLGTFDLFLAAVERPGSEQSYELIVDRSVGLPAAFPTGPSGNADGSAQPSGEPTGAGSSPAAATPTATSTSTSTEPAAHPPTALHHPRHPVRGVAVRRASNNIVCQVTLAPGSHLQELQGWLMREGHALGVASQRVHGDAVKLALHTDHRPPAGRYHMVITTTDARGEQSSARFPVTLR